MRLRVLVIIASLATVQMACSVVEEGTVDQINPPFGLDDTLPTTSTIVTTTTMAATTTSGLETTTTPPVQSEQVRLYFVASRQLTSVTAQLPSPVTLPQIVAALQAGPPEGELGTGLRSTVPPLAEIDIIEDRSGVAQVELPEGFFDTISPGDQRLVIAQLVLTLTDSRGIGQVVFNQAVPKPSGEIIPAGQPLAYRDYLSLLSSTTTPTTTSMVTIPPETSTP